jgi:hypothetical protein
MDESRKLAEGWHLDRRVPITIIITMCLQFGWVLWWAAGIEHDRAELMNARSINQTPCDGLKASWTRKLSGHEQSG